MNTLSFRQEKFETRRLLLDPQTDTPPILTHNPFQQVVDDAVKWSLAWSQAGLSSDNEQCLEDETLRHSHQKVRSATELKAMINQLWNDVSPVATSERFLLVLKNASEVEKTGKIFR